MQAHFDRFTEGIRAIEEIESDRRNQQDGWKPKGKGTGNGKGKSKGLTKTQKINNKIAHCFKALAMEGPGAPDIDVESYSGRIDQTKEGNLIFSAVVRKSTKH